MRGEYYVENIGKKGDVLAHVRINLHLHRIDRAAQKLTKLHL